MSQEYIDVVYTCDACAAEEKGRRSDIVPLGWYSVMLSHRCGADKYNSGPMIGHACSLDCFLSVLDQQLKVVLDMPEK